MSDFVATDGLKTQEPNQPSSGCLPLSFQNSEEIPEPLTLTLAPPAPSDDSSRSPLARRMNVVPSDSTSANPIPLPKATIPSDRRPKQKYFSTQIVASILRGKALFFHCQENLSFRPRGDENTCGINFELGKFWWKVNLEKYRSIPALFPMTGAFRSLSPLPASLAVEMTQFHLSIDLPGSRRYSVRRHLAPASNLTPSGTNTRGPTNAS